MTRRLRFKCFRIVRHDDLQDRHGHTGRAEGARRRDEGNARRRRCPYAVSL